MLFSNETVNTGRQRELDVAKGLAIILMILNHVFDDLGPKSSAFHKVFDLYIALPLGATGFMFCMGAGIAYTRRSSAVDCAKRGLMLLTFGQVLNIFRYVIPSLISYAILGDVKVLFQLCLIISCDIMQLAELLFLVIGGLKKLRANENVIFAFSIFMSLLGMKLNGLHTDNYFVNQLLGFFWGTDTESYFPLFHWFIFAAAGLWCGKLYSHLADKRRFFTLVLVLGIPFYIFFCTAGNSFFKFIGDDYTAFTRMNTIDAVCSLAMVVSFIGICWLISLISPEIFIKPLEYASRNINKFYCVSYVVLMTTSYFAFTELNADIDAIIAWIIISLVTAGVIALYQMYLEKKFAEFFSAHKVFWILLVWCVSVVIAARAFSVFDKYPNYLNGYRGY